MTETLTTIRRLARGWQVDTYTHPDAAIQTRLFATHQREVMLDYVTDLEADGARVVEEADFDREVAERDALAPS